MTQPGDRNLHWLLAAKFRENHGFPAPYHPLFCHMADAAAVAEVLWDQVLPRSLRERIAGALHLDDAGARQWTAFIAGCHDIGKASPAFQVKDRKRRTPIDGWLEATPLSWPETVHPENVPHGTVSEFALRETYRRHGAPPVAAPVLAAIDGGHHGIFPRPADLLKLRLLPDSTGNAPWPAAREALVDELAAALGIVPLAEAVRIPVPVAMILAGLTTVVDWIGSDERYFGYWPGRDAEEYMAEARRRAAHALGELHWLGWAPPAEPATFGDLFGFGDDALFPVQRAAIELADELAGPGLVIVEAPMGEGKTEAAIYLADRWNAGGHGRGIYFALPTMATSNQMFGRVKRYLERRHGTSAAHINLQLLHGHAALLPEFEALQEKGKRVPVPRGVAIDEPGAGEEEGSVIAGGWFAQRKRALLAPFGVGTVDQALLSALQVKHVFVRLFGLAGKPVIIDEVHAYDAYMSQLLERLLEWLAALGSPVVLLSATLPRARRDALIAAYAKGLGAAKPVIEPVGYPRIAWASAAGSGAREVPAAGRSKRAVHIERISREPEAIVHFLEQRLSEGGCAAVICNTVGRAQQVYAHLKDCFPGEASDGEPVVGLLHSRYTVRDRMWKEKAALARFSKADETVTFPDETVRPVVRPQRAILVATQVIEQSLDLDFDVMVSDLAPVDFVLQRSGRLQRHQRPPRPAPVAEPVMAICMPEGDDVPKLGPDVVLPYDDHTILRSWLALRGKAEIRLPEDFDPLIAAVYDDDVAAPEEPVLAERWASSRDALSKEQAKEADQAKQRLIKRPSTQSTLAEMVERFLQEDSPDLHKTFQALTRLADPSLPVVIAWKQPGGSFADSEGLPVDTRATPAGENAKRLLEQSLSVSRALYRALKDQPPPAPWKRSAYLSEHRLIALEADGTATIGGVSLSYDAELGLRVTATRQERRGQ